MLLDAAFYFLSHYQESCKVIPLQFLWRGWSIVSNIREDLRVSLVLLQPLTRFPPGLLEANKALNFINWKGCEICSSDTGT